MIYHHADTETVARERQRMYDEGERARKSLASLVATEEKRARARKRLTAHIRAISGHRYPSAKRRARYARRERLTQAVLAASCETTADVQHVLRWAR